MRVAISVVALVLVAALGLPAGAVEPAPHITDPAGDANAINGQGIVTGSAAQGTSTPVGYAPADLLAVRYATAYKAVPVGGDGLTYVQSGLEAHITTAAPATSAGPTLIYRLNVEVGSCGGFVQYYLNGPASGPTDGTTLEFRQFASRGCAADATIRPAGWYASVTGNTLVFHMPLSGLSGADRSNFSVGRSVVTSTAEVRTQLAALTAPAIDLTAPGTTFVIGSDRPADVPCTVGCP